MATTLVQLTPLLPHVLGQQGNQLRVSLRDTAGQGISAATITLASADGDAIATQITDARGQVLFGALPSGIVRVRVEGAMIDGIPLVLQGHDGDGIRFALTGQTQLDLGVEDDGHVLPDPATMIAPERFGTTIEENNREFNPDQAIATPPPASFPSTGVAHVQATETRILISSTTSMGVSDLPAANGANPYAVLVMPICLVLVTLLCGVACWRVLWGQRR